MKIVRWLATLVIWSAAVAAIAAFVVRPQRCNVIEGEVQRSVDRVTSVPTDETVTVPIARQNIARLSPCMDCADGVNRAMVLAANYRLMGQYAKAIEIYRDALRYDHRPELYLNLGQAQLDMGDEEAGMRSVITACLGAPNLVEAVPGRHEQLYEIVHNHYLQLVENAKKRGVK
jgi:tetratricopeptide (TPR) repeat protein